MVQTKWKLNNAELNLNLRSVLKKLETKIPRSNQKGLETS